MFLILTASPYTPYTSPGTWTLTPETATVNILTYKPSDVFCTITTMYMPINTYFYEAVISLLILHPFYSISWIIFYVSKTWYMSFFWNGFIAFCNVDEPWGMHPLPYWLLDIVIYLFLHCSSPPPTERERVRERKVSSTWLGLLYILSGLNLLKLYTLHVFR